MYSIEYASPSTLISMNKKPDKYPVRLIHLSTVNLDNRVLKPRIPDSRLDGEDNAVKRVCFSSCVTGALRGLGLPFSSQTIYVHTPVDPIQTLRPIRPTAEQVEDVKTTREWWVTRPVRLKCIGQIRFSPDRKHYWYVKTADTLSVNNSNPVVWDELGGKETVEINLLSKVLSSRTHRSSVALMKIRHLIQTSYGGLVTEKEWNNTSNPVYTIYKDRRCKTLYVGKTCARTPISFHTKGQAKLFLSRPENERLMFDYLS